MEGLFDNLEGRSDSKFWTSNFDPPFFSVCSNQLSYTSVWHILFHRKTRARIPAQSKASFFPQKDFEFFMVNLKKNNNANKRSYFLTKLCEIRKSVRIQNVMKHSKYFYLSTYEINNRLEFRGKHTSWSRGVKIISEIGPLLLISIMVLSTLLEECVAFS